MVMLMRNSVRSLDEKDTDGNLLPSQRSTGMPRPGSKKGISSDLRSKRDKRDAAADTTATSIKFKDEPPKKKPKITKLHVKCVRDAKAERARHAHPMKRKKENKANGAVGAWIPHGVACRE
uniref:Expressed conserved protein n=1 Tax=Haemonchus contortus TaxID=6289 RepID=A0A7I4YYD9_HAECO